MSKHKIGRVLSRTRKQDFGARKKPFPKKLEFLSKISFYAVTECLLPDSSRRQTRIEILPNQLKEYIVSYEDVKKLKKDKRRLRKELKEEKLRADLHEQENEKLKAINQQLMKNIEDDFTHPNSSIKSNIQMIEERGQPLRGIPSQAGAYGLGGNDKRKNVTKRRRKY